MFSMVKVTTASAEAATASTEAATATAWSKSSTKWVVGVESRSSSSLSAKASRRLRKLWIQIMRTTHRLLPVWNSTQTWIQSSIRVKTTAIPWSTKATTGLEKSTVWTHKIAMWAASRTTNSHRIRVANYAWLLISKRILCWSHIWLISWWSSSIYL